MPGRRSSAAGRARDSRPRRRCSRCPEPGARRRGPPRAARSHGRRPLWSARRGRAAGASSRPGACRRARAGATGRARRAAIASVVLAVRRRRSPPACSARPDAVSLSPSSVASSLLFSASSRASLALARGHREPGELGERRRLRRSDPPTSCASSRLRSNVLLAPARSRPRRVPRSRRQSGPSRACRARRPRSRRAPLPSQRRPSPISPRVLQKRTSAPASCNAELDLAGRDRPGERGADVVVLLVEAVRARSPGWLASARARPPATSSR